MAMGCGLHFVVILVYLFVNISPAVARDLSKRAEAFPKYRGSVTERTVSTTPYKEDGTVRSRAQCPIGHLPQTHENRTVCCRPVVCSSGFEIKTCSTDGGKDKCVECKKGYIQVDTISSFNTTETSCFPLYKSHERCPVDTKKSRHQPPRCWMFCECKTEKCYVGSPCGCTLVDPCGTNQQLNKHTKKCEPCPPYSYKHKGCEACTYNLTAFSLGMPLQVEEDPDLTTHKGTDSSSEGPSIKIAPSTEKQNQQTTIIVLVVCGLVMIIIILLLIAWRYRQSRMMQRLRTKLCSDRSESSASRGNVYESSSERLIGNQTESVDQTQTQLSMENPQTTPSTPEGDDSGFKSSQEINPLADLDQGESSIHDGAAIVPGELNSITEPSETSEQTFSKVVVDLPTDTSREEEMSPREVLAAGGEVIVRGRVIEMCDKSVDNQYSLQEEEKPKPEKPVAFIRPLKREDDAQMYRSQSEIDDSIGVSSITSYPQLCLSSMRMRFDLLESQEPNSSVALGGQPEPHVDNYSEIHERVDGQSLLNQDNSLTIRKQIFFNENTLRKSEVERSNLKEEDEMEGKQEEQMRVFENDSSLPTLPSDDISYEVPLYDEPSDSVEIGLDSDVETGQFLENNETNELTHQQAPVLGPTGERERGDGADSIETEMDASVEIDIALNI